MQTPADDLLWVRREGEPLFARVWFDLIDDRRLTKKHALTLYMALGRAADFRASAIKDLTGQDTRETGYYLSRPQAATCRRLMQDARIGSRRTFRDAMDALTRTGWVRADRFDSDYNDYAQRLGLPRLYRQNWPPIYTLIRPVARRPSVHK